MTERKTRDNLIKRYHKLIKEAEELSRMIDTAPLGVCTEKDDDGWSLDDIAYRLSILLAANP